jgi:hypothetical protein
MGRITYSLIGGLTAGLLKCSFWRNMSIDVDMRTFYHVVGEALRQGPPERWARVTPWIIAVLGAGMLLLMGYAWARAWFGQ